MSNNNGSVSNVYGSMNWNQNLLVHLNKSEPTCFKGRKGLADWPTIGAEKNEGLQGANESNLCDDYTEIPALNDVLYLHKFSNGQLILETLIKTDLQYQVEIAKNNSPNISYHLSSHHFSIVINFRESGVGVAEEEILKFLETVVKKKNNSEGERLKSVDNQELVWEYNFNFRFTPEYSKFLMGKTIRLLCVMGDPEEGSIGTVKVEEVSEID